MNKVSMFNGCYYDCDLCYKYYKDIKIGKDCDGVYKPANKRMIKTALKIAQEKFEISTKAGIPFIYSAGFPSVNKYIKFLERFEEDNDNV